MSLKGAKSPTRGRKLRSTGTKARVRASNEPNSLTELKKQLEARTRELTEAREQQAATSEILRVISSSVCCWSDSRSSLSKRVFSMAIAGRGADDLQHLRGRGLLLQRFAQLVEKPRVLDGDAAWSANALTSSISRSEKSATCPR